MGRARPRPRRARARRALRLRPAVAAAGGARRVVVGVDQSAPLLAHAERNRDGIGAERLRYRQHDLRAPLDEGGFDAAINIYSSLGYGSEEDDLAILTTLRKAVRKDGRVFVDTMHRDVIATLQARGLRHAERLSDGTLVIEQPRFDGIRGRVETTWHWSGPRGSGQQERVDPHLLHHRDGRADGARGARLVSAHRACSPEPFKSEGPDLGGRVGLLGRPG